MTHVHEACSCSPRRWSALGLSLILGACGTEQGSPGPSPGEITTVPEALSPSDISGEHNEADIRIAQMMIPHHRQALRMAELVTEQTDHPEIAALAKNIRKTQEPEIQTMIRFLETWGAKAPPDDAAGEMGHGDGRSGMQDGMTMEQMERLHNSTGARFDQMFLEMMITHHEDAIADAQRHQAEGLNPQALALAGQIIAAQTQKSSTCDSC